MRITYIDTETVNYWAKRWHAIEVDSPMLNTNIYPLKYALKSVKSKEEKILEAGCGLGRILRYFHEKNYIIEGIDYITEAIDKLQKVDPTLKVSKQDIKKLDFEENYFDVILAFGLFHGLENGLEKSLNETRRVLKTGGTLCVSFRADNLQNRINDFLNWFSSKNKFKKKKFFHKINLSKSEFIKLLNKSNFNVISCENVVNMPLLYKFKLFRSIKHYNFNENLAREEGYKLSLIGNIIQALLIKFFPNQFCNIFVAICN
tara:strand:- start:3251 stop:4030 length:780 start_codon:yes stop_codon:yes gene_type:complete